jgi:hypothetical protein
MDKIRAVLACSRLLASRGRRAGRYVVARTKAVWYSIQDHATPLVVTSWTLVVGGLVLLVLYDTKAVTLMKDYQPVIALVAVLTGVAIRIHKWLKEMRDKRIRPPQGPSSDNSGGEPDGSPAPLNPAVIPGTASRQPAERT